MEKSRFRAFVRKRQAAIPQHRRLTQIEAQKIFDAGMASCPKCDRNQEKKRCLRLPTCKPTGSYASHRTQSARLILSSKLPASNPILKSFASKKTRISSSETKIEDDEDNEEDVAGGGAGDTSVRPPARPTPQQVQAPPQVPPQVRSQPQPQRLSLNDVLGRRRFSPNLNAERIKQLENLKAKKNTTEVIPKLLIHEMLQFYADTDLSKRYEAFPTKEIRAPRVTSESVLQKKKYLILLFMPLVLHRKLGSFLLIGAWLVLIFAVRSATGA